MRQFSATRREAVSSSSRSASCSSSVKISFSLLSSCRDLSSNISSVVTPLSLTLGFCTTVSHFLFLRFFEIASLLKKSPSAFRADEYASRLARSPNSSNDATQNGSLFRINSVVSSSSFTSSFSFSSSLCPSLTVAPGFVQSSSFFSFFRHVFVSPNRDVPFGRNSNTAAFVLESKVARSMRMSRP